MPVTRGDSLIKVRLRLAVGGNTPPECCNLFFESPTVTNKKSHTTHVVWLFLVTRWRFELQTHCLKGDSLIEYALKSSDLLGFIEKTHDY